MVGQTLSSDVMAMVYKVQFNRRLAGKNFMGKRYPNGNLKMVKTVVKNSPTNSNLKVPSSWPKVITNEVKQIAIKVIKLRNHFFTALK